MSAPGANDVALPNRANDQAARSTKMSAGTQGPKALAVVSQRSPTIAVMLKSTTSRRVMTRGREMSLMAGTYGALGTYANSRGDGPLRIYVPAAKLYHRQTT